MSELAEFRRILSDIRDATTRTAQDVGWIKEGIKATSDKMDDHDKRIGALERRQHWYAGVAAAVGAMLGFGGAHLPKF